METYDLEAVKHTVFSDEADLILYSDPKHLHHVSSKILRAASPVFRAMFGPDFAEGRALLKVAGSSLPVVRLHDDHDMSLYRLFWILHRSNPSFYLNSYRTDFVWQLALLADKYDCVAALAPHSASMFKRFDIESMLRLDVEEVAHRNSDLVYAAYVLDCAEYFRKFTDVLIRKGYYVDFMAYKDDLAVDELADSLSQCLQQRDDECRDQLQKKISDVAKAIEPYLCQEQVCHRCRDERGSGDSKCHFDSQQRIATRYMEALIKTRLWPLSPKHRYTVSDLLGMIEPLNPPEWDRIPASEKEGETWCLERPEFLDKKIEGLKECADRFCAGLCLDCFKKCEGGTKICRIPHEQFALKRT